MEYLSHPPPEPDFWIYFASYLRNGWMQLLMDKMKKANNIPNLMVLREINKVFGIKFHKNS
ncbi:hypothetical protein YYG_04666 [Plasmodium vinckei petteri]|uniref:Uncharacterized protein n=1 Tax=Plasmodium vinckei petteri TaxID=138298 RepID=W7AFL4_PLAVN|nr:hypothetical protein YYG_04666 [Plasmodium vinckei petteri]